MPNFIGSGFTLESLTQTGQATLRLKFTNDPVATSASGAHDALNPANYSLSGPDANAVASILTVSGDPQSVSLELSAPLVAGKWTLTVSNVQSVDATSLSSPTSLDVIATALAAIQPLSQGAQDDDAESLLHKFLPFAGKGWDALVAALATGDKYNRDLASSAFDQLFTSTATGSYLDRSAANDGAYRPNGIGMSDDLFRKLTIKTTNTKQVSQVMLETLEVFYGSEATRANALSAAAEPYALQDGDSLVIQLNGKTPYTVVFSSASFGQIGRATAEEVATAITIALRRLGSTGYAVAYNDPSLGQSFVRIYSGALGLRGSVRVTGGSAQSVLQFPTVTQNLQSTGRMATVIQAVPGELEVILPATTQAVGRGQNSAAYLHTQSAITIISVTRLGTGVVTANTATNHGLSVGQWVFVDGVYPDNATVVTTGFSNGDSLNVVTPTYHNRAVKLQDGRVLVTGGYNGTVGIVNCFLFDPTTNIWSAAASMAHARYGHTLTVLTNGKVLAVGGSGDATCELYDPTTNTWTATGAALIARTWHTATLLNSGLVWTVGGSGDTSSGLYDPVAGTWSAGPTMSVSRSKHAAVKLPDGRVVVTGCSASSISEIYNPINSVVRSAGTSLATDYQIAFYTPNIGSSGTVLDNGGLSVSSTVSNSTLYFNPNTLGWGAGNNSVVARYLHTVTPLKNGVFLIVGGASTTTTPVATTEKFDSVNQKFTASESLSVTRAGHSAVGLDDGRVLIIGGYDLATTIRGVEIYSTYNAVVTAGGLNGLVQVVSVPSNTSFTYSTPSFTQATTAIAGGTVTPIAATTNGISGPFVYDTDDGVGVTGIATTTSTQLVANSSYTAIIVVDATAFPDAPGYVVFAFGTDNQTAPIKYYGRTSNTSLLIDPTYVFENTLAQGTSITLLIGRDTWVPETPEQVGSFYVTDASAGRVAAEDVIDNLAAAGISVNKVVIYPSDIGLGNEGAPDSGAAKLSDRIVVWGGDDVDNEVATAREE